MPKYNYRCGECGATTTRSLPMKDRKKPEGEPCSCGKLAVKFIMNKASNVVSGLQGVHSTSESFKDTLREIKKHAGKGSTIDV